MRLLRVFYTVAIVVSLGLAFVFYYQSHLKDRELAQYRDLSRLSSEALKKVSAKLGQSKKELDRSLKEIEKLNKAMAALEKEKSSSKGELQALKEEREKLQTKIARLLEEKTVLETNLLSLVKKFRSLEELKKAIKIAKIEKRHRSKMERIQRRLAKIEMLRALDEIALRQGNRGYLVAQGKSTFMPRAKVRVKLEPVEKWSYREIEVENK